MSDFKKNQKRNIGKNILFGLGGLLILGVSVVLVVANISIYHKKVKYLSQVDGLQKQIAALKEKNNDLKQGISNQDNDQYMEKVAREELDLQKPGEKVVSFIMPETQVQKEAPVSTNFFQQWLSWLKNKF